MKCEMLSEDVVEEFGNGVGRRQREKGRGWCMRGDFEKIGYSNDIQMILGIEPRFFNLDWKIWSN